MTVANSINVPIATENRILLIGVGGAASNALTYIYRSNESLPADLLLINQ